MSVRRVVVRTIIEIDGRMWTVNCTPHGDVAALNISGPAPGSPWLVLVNRESCRVKTNEALPVDVVRAVAEALARGPVHNRLWPSARLELVR